MFLFKNIVSVTSQFINVYLEDKQPTLVFFPIALSEYSITALVIRLIHSSPFLAVESDS